MKTLLVAGLALALCSAHANADDGAAAQRDAMAKVAWMAGTWEGASTIQARGGEARSVSTETVRAAAGGAALLVQGMHFRALPDGKRGEVTHDTAAMLTFDTASSKYRFATQLADGKAGTFEGSFKDGVFSWFMPLPQGQVRYDISRSDKGQWVETGHFCAPQGECRPFFSMALTRTGDAN